LVRTLKLLIGVGEAESSFKPSPFRILGVAIVLGFCFLGIVTFLIIFTGTFL
jgi:hypothetical protein|tara:strand:- start:600 stop:755 length:156 start_codon:yes stop_codon:yes gene_type:complete